MVPDADYRIKLPVFEGPLDLLLFLIRKNEIDIYDIPIESVTRQYLDVLRNMKELDLEIAGDFFVMAATLMEIKSRMLLPKGHHAIDPNAEDDDPIDPRYELVHQLLQYKKFKEAARELQELATFQDNKLPRLVTEEKLGEEDRPLKPVDRIDLWNAFNLVLRRLAEKLVVGEIQDEQVTVSDQMEVILEKLRTEKTFLFTSLLPERIELRMLVASFLAVLELARLGKLRVRQDDAFTDIICTARETAAHEPEETTAHEPEQRSAGIPARETPADTETSPATETAPTVLSQPQGREGSLPEMAVESGQAAAPAGADADAGDTAAQNTLETPAGPGTVTP
ncbi:segregation/condensation protein A [Termitidicoccus mucosus]|uniref:segregation/condensation protein A n=1 Tax=Termitidicoccus mucosus TaxID=1184151 RepID=UPI000A009AE0